MSTADPAAVSRFLRALLASVDAGEVEGGAAAVAYLTGAADTLEMVTEMEPDSLRNTTGCEPAVATGTAPIATVGAVP